MVQCYYSTFFTTLVDNRKMEMLLKLIKKTYNVKVLTFPESCQQFSHPSPQNVMNLQKKI